MALIARYLDDNLTPIPNLLKMSSQSRSGTPDGNIYFNYVNREIELITYEELAQIDFGNGLVDNPLNNYDKITMRAIYGFERYWRHHDETMREFKAMVKGKYMGNGAYKLINDGTFANNDHMKVGLSGWEEWSYAGVLQRVWTGISSMGSIDIGTTPMYQLVDENGDVLDFSRSGPMMEVIQTYDDNGGSPIDKRGYLRVMQRQWGSIHDEAHLAKMGQTSVNGYNVPNGVTELSHPSTGQYNEADVIGPNAVSPWTGMRLERFDVPQKRSGFLPDESVEYDYTWILHNDENGTREQCIAYLDACARYDGDIDAGTTVVANGKKCGLWYQIVNGKYITQSGLDGGLHIDGLDAEGRNSIEQTDDTNVSRAYPVKAVVEITVLDVQTKTAVVDARVLLVKDSDDTVLMNTVTDADGKASFGYDYTGDVAVNGRVRRATTGTLYKTSVVGGVITSTGMKQVVYLIKDE